MKIIFILAFFSVIVYLATKKLSSKIATAGAIFLFFAALGYFIPLSESNELLLERVILNLAPATLFLFMLDVDLKRFLKNGIGCSCKMGAKRYWLIVLFALLASFVAQIAAFTLFPSYPLLGASVFGTILGLLASFSPLRSWCGTEDVATTMLYLLLSAVAMRIF